MAGTIQRQRRHYPSLIDLREYVLPWCGVLKQLLVTENDECLPSTREANENSILNVQETSVAVII